MKKIFIIIFTSLFLLTGCYDNIELDNLSIITGVGIDYLDDEFKLTYEILSDTKTEENTALLSYSVSGSGKTISEAFTNTNYSVSKKAYFSHLKLLVLSEEIIELATAYDIGWCASIEDSTIVWKIWNGVDRTAGQTENNRMMLDYGYGTMNNSTLTVENTVPTFMIVAGQGEGADRSIEELNNGATGLSRIETFLDARDIEDDTLLPQRGQEKLAEYGDNSSYTATLSNQAIQQYRTEFDLGDIGTIRDEKLDGSLDYRITSIEEVYEEHQIMINVVFGYDKNTLKDSIQRMNSKRDALLAVESYSGGGSTGGGGCDCEPLTTTDDGAGNVIVGGGCVSVSGGSSGVDLTKVLNTFFPVGSIYVTNTNSEPAFGGTWNLEH